MVKPKIAYKWQIPERFVAIGPKDHKKYGVETGSNPRNQWVVFDTLYPIIGVVRRWPTYGQAKRDADNRNTRAMWKDCQVT